MTPPRSRARAGGNPGAGATNGPSLNETAYRAIKADIIACVLQPGEEISEAVLVGRYGFSKAPIRSALMRLRQEGLIVSRGRQGNIVSPVTLRDVKEVFQLRLLLEVAAARLAAGRVEPERIRELNSVVHAGFTPGDAASEAAYLEANREFHRYVAQASGNQRLAALLVDLMEQHERIVHLGLALQSRGHEFVHFHDDLVNALVDGDADRAAALTERALRGGQEKVLEALLASDNQISLAEVTPERSL